MKTLRLGYNSRNLGGLDGGTKFVRTDSDVVYKVVKDAKWPMVTVRIVETGEEIELILDTLCWIVTGSGSEHQQLCVKHERNSWDSILWVIPAEDGWLPDEHHLLLECKVPQCYRRYIYNPTTGELKDTECTDARDRHHVKRCPTCDTDLKAVRDHYGGGSHYWVLECTKCEITYSYDTYRFKLEAWKK